MNSNLFILFVVVCPNCIILIGCACKISRQHSYQVLFIYYIFNSFVEI